MSNSEYFQPPSPLFIKRFPKFIEDDGLTKVKMTVELSEILNIDEVRNEITFKFTTDLTWRDPRLEFHFLKDNQDRNIIKTDIWVC